MTAKRKVKPNTEILLFFFFSHSLSPPGIPTFRTEQRRRVNSITMPRRGCAPPSPRTGGGSKNTGPPDLICIALLLPPCSAPFPPPALLLLLISTLVVFRTAEGDVCFNFHLSGDTSLCGSGESRRKLPLFSAPAANQSSLKAPPPPPQI